jgi:ubiquitin-protein ligase
MDISSYVKSYFAIGSKRILAELKLLIRDPIVQSYFHYESLGNDEKSGRFCIYGYLLPRLEPYNYGSYKVCIIIPEEFPFKPPVLQLFTYIYHPDVEDSISEPKFCDKCYFDDCIWDPVTRISQWIERYINGIDRPNGMELRCVRNQEAKDLYDQDKGEYEKKVLAMVRKYSCPRPNQSIISLKYAAKQIIRKQLYFESAKIDQLPLSPSLKQYLKSPLSASEHISSCSMNM